ncbi:MAG TPA: polyphosphate kinase 2 family protein, partial [Ktedonobacteraceae bacterium]|nr:polyphosphate kinase 2 family protein [Ktedonobacteraceae bacterium]
MQLAWKVAEGSKVRLRDYDPDFVDKHTDRALAAAEIEKLSEELGELQQLLAAAQHHSLLIVLQGMDTSGKDGTIRQVMAQVNPLGCEVRSFKGPTSRERVHNLVPEKVWRRRYAAINDFERLLAQNDMIILKFYLHISYEEQEQRLLARQADKTKAWKLSSADWAERKYWNDYQQAYGDALSRCSTDVAP